MSKLTFTATAAVTGDDATQFAADLQKSIRATLSAAGITIPVAVTETGGKISFASGADSFEFTLKFNSPVTVTAGTGSLSLGSPSVQFSYDKSKAAITISRHVDITPKSYSDPSFQQLGIADLADPARVRRRGDAARDGNRPEPLREPEGDPGLDRREHAADASHTINDLVQKLQDAIDQAITAAITGGELGATSDSPDAYKVKVCRAEPEAVCRDPVRRPR